MKSQTCKWGTGNLQVAAALNCNQSKEVWSLGRESGCNCGLLPTALKEIPQVKLAVADSGV